MDALCTGTDSDLLFTDGVAEPATSMALAAQQIENALNIARGEWIVDATAGVDWMRYLTEKLPSLTQIRQDILRALEDAPVTVDTIEVTHTGRTLSVVLTLRRGGDTFIGTLAVDPARDKLGNNGYMAAFYPQFVVSKIRSR